MLALTACGGSSPTESQKNLAAPGCGHVNVANWASATDANQLPVHVEVPQPGGWQADPEIARLFTSTLAAHMQPPQGVIAVVRPTPGDDRTPPTFVSAIYDISDNYSATTPEAYLAGEVEDITGALTADGDTQVGDEAATTLCGWPARSYVTLTRATSQFPQPSSVYNLRSIVAAGGRTYEVLLSASPHNPDDADLVTMLTGVKLVTGVD